MRSRLLILLVFTILWHLLPGHAHATEPGAAAYDPLRIPAGEARAPVDLTVADPERQREIPIRVYLPTQPTPAAVVLFSHGLGGSREGSSFLAKHWAARGFVAVFLQHPGSDNSVWKGKPLTQLMGSMNEAANGQNLLLRVKDVPVVLDQLENWNSQQGHTLYGRLDLTRVGMSGHSFGAVTTQAVAGQSFPTKGQCFNLPGLKAACIFSPSSPRVGSAAKAFGSVAIPWLLMTGTHDTAPIGNISVESRLAVFPALPPGKKYELVLDGGQHFAFTGRDVARGSAVRNPNHHRVILALSTAFWDAYLNDSGTARAWLDGDGPASVLEPKDRWQKK